MSDHLSLIHNNLDYFRTEWLLSKHRAAVEAQIELEEGLQVPLEYKEETVAS